MVFLFSLPQLNASSIIKDYSSIVNQRYNVSRIMFPVTVNVQSQVFYIGGCWYQFTGVLKFDWDGIPNHAPTNVTFTNMVLTQSCPSTNGQHYARVTVDSYTGDRNGTNISISTDDSEISTLCEGVELNIEVKKIINDEIHKITD